MDIYDFEDEREMERDKDDMEIVIDELVIRIPEELIQERIKLLEINRIEIQSMIYEQAKEYQECLMLNGKYNLQTFEQKFVDYLDSEFAMYRL